MQEFIKKVLGSRTSGSGTTTLILPNEGMKNIMKIVKPLEDSDSLVKGVTQAIENETKEQMVDFLLCY